MNFQTRTEKIAVPATVKKREKSVDEDVKTYMIKMKINRIVSFFMKYYIVSGGFDPIHEGHIAMINEAACRSDGVILLLNSDEWLCRKKGKNFMNFHTRKTICENLKNVTKVLAFNDDDNSAGDGIRLVREQFPDAELIFANGGDRTRDNIPETEVCKNCNVSLEFGIGGENKANSSSWILNNWKKE